MDEFKLPEPGLAGDYSGSCVVCLKGTDTGIAFVGEAEWAVAGLTVLGLPTDQASEMVRASTGSDPGKVPVGEITVSIRLCSACAEPVGFPVGLVATGVPAVRPKT